MDFKFYKDPSFTFKLHFYPFEIPFKENITIKEGVILEKRSFILIHLQNKDHFLDSFGLISPLEGLNQETIPSIAHYIKNNLEPNQFYRYEGLSKSPPSLKFGIEEALFHHFLKISNFEKEDLPTIKIATLEKLSNQFFINDKIGFYKIKLGHSHEFDNELNTLEKVLDNPIKIRLDPNDFLNHYNQIKLIHFLKKISNKKRSKIEFIEDFLPKTSFDSHLFSLAIDLKLADYIFFNACHEIKLKQELPKNCLFIVIKPSLWGIFNTIRLINYSKQHGLTPIISSCYNHPYSIALFNRLICQQNLTDLHHGIDTTRYFKKEFSSKTLIELHSDLKELSINSLAIS